MVKVNWNLDYDETETAHVNDVEFHVKKRIPYEKKMELAELYAEAVAMIEDDGSANWNPYHEIYWVYLLIRYYTDIELTEGDNIGWIYDYAVEYDLEHAIDEVAEKDIRASRMFAHEMVEMVLTGWEQSHSLQGTLNRLTSDEEMQKLAHAAPMNQELVGLLQEKQDIQSGVKVVPLMEFAKREK